ncbi:mitochondrial glutathione reductase Pgr1 [Schizosaccharomyces osmophilus]|uniref:Glutathione reductase n=1 Tax=Schizosaccharomyces osmophilus TaxID=2545709 RepID=A0AAF0AW19_9SCHI|nr:mitochondrial glutathione reductase Pgr1 [Schizosaccharomyces osmophilus]WBW72620.1 mitochondrial glutathione reductase Pgr1 [Schizosaccharomyces osmophilus]
MPPTTKAFDYLVIGGGSGGLASARRAAKYGAKVGLVEASGRLGGTCVNYGCVPKKIMWNIADLVAKMKTAPQQGFPESNIGRFDWGLIKRKRDAYIKRLNGIYERNVNNDGVLYISGHASFISPTEVAVDMLDGSGVQTFSAKNILIAVGGRPIWPSHIPGAEYGIDSDGFFELEEQPKKVAVVGAGYIAIELAGVFAALGTETHLFIRRDKFLRRFDPIVSDGIMKHFEHLGIHIHKNSDEFSKIEKLPSSQLRLHSEQSALDVDSLLWAVGRTPKTEGLRLDRAGVKTLPSGHVVADEYQRTNVPSVLSLGDVVGKIELTPVAIAAGRRLSDRLFGGVKDAHLDYINVPSVVFAHPEAGTIGFTEQEAIDKYGENEIKVYNSTFRGLNYALVDEENKVPTTYKLICAGPLQKVVGLHMVGDFSSEILQGFGVAIKMGATKADFDNCVAIHPTSAEELVTLV